MDIFKGVKFPSREEMRAQGHAARMQADPGEAPRAGHFYTVSPDFTFGDRSWCDCFWEVMTVNGANAFVRIHDHRETIDRFWPIAERAWYLADDAKAASEARK